MPETERFPEASVPIRDIRVNGQLRRPDPEKVRQLAESICGVGLLHPLVLSEDHFLLAGGHRLEALKLIGYERVQCQIAPFLYDSSDAQIIALDENLMRKELTVLEQSEHLLKREELLQETTSSASLSMQRITVPVALSTSHIARDVGIPEGVAKRRLEIARNLTSEQRDILRDTPLADQQKELMELARIKNPERRTNVIRLLVSDDPPATVSEAVRVYRITNGEISADLDIIKPSNWWVFGRPKWQRRGFAGGIPGEVYANALYYFAPENGVVADGMAGGAMIRRVYDDRRAWQRNRKFDLEVRLYDLYPREPFASRYGINPHSMTQPLPEMVDWLFVDPPYFRIAADLYEGVLAQTRDYVNYCDLMGQVINAAWHSLKPGGVFCLIITPYIDITNINNPVLDVPADMRLLALQSGFEQVFRVYVSRGIQQTRAAGVLNIKAKTARRMFSDVCELLVFRRGE